MHARNYLKLSVAVAVATIILKTGAWWLTDSVGLLSDALESLVNLAGAVFALVMVTIAAQPPDADHPYGHHKAEYFSSGFEGILIAAAAVAMAVAAVHRILSPVPLQALGVGLALSVVSSAMNGALAWSMLRKSRTERSMALEADARHLYTDVWTSVGVVAGLLAVQATGWQWMDPVIALVMAANIAREGGKLTWRSVDGLMDRAVEPEVRREIERTLAGFAHGTIRFDHLATRRAGQRRFVDLHMHMPSSWSLGRAASLRGSVEQALMSAVPGLRATIQLLPMDVEAHFNDEKDPLVIALVQRVSEARVVVGGAVVGEIGAGLLVLVCAEPADTEVQAAKLVDKLLKLRIFGDDAGKMNRSVVDVGGGLLIVSQFTLAADTAGGNRPSFTGAAGPEQGQRLYETVLRLARERHAPVAAGEFGADMKVALVNDGPVTIPLRIG